MKAAVYVMMGATDGDFDAVSIHCYVVATGRGIGFSKIIKNVCQSSVSDKSVSAPQSSPRQAG